MKIAILFALANFTGYVIGCIVGRWETEQKIEQMRQEMQTDEEEDPFNEIFK